MSAFKVNLPFAMLYYTSLVWHTSLIYLTIKYIKKGIVI